MKLKDQIALVTGASRGIGRSVALSLAQKGARVIGTATSEQGALDISTAFEQAGLPGRGIVLNVTDPASIESAFENVKSTEGSPTILVNNAAITRDNIMLRMKDEEWESIITTNLTSIYRLSKICLKDMVKARYGRIINISSVVATTGNFGQANYVAAKAGVIGFTKSLAQEVASRNITVNVVSPGFIDTDMTRAVSEDVRKHLLDIIPMKRAGQPEDIAKAVSFLASDDASYITGVTLHVNGGMFMA